MTDNNIYQFSAPRWDGSPVSLSHYKNKVLLIVNTASQCGFAPQLKELVELKKEFIDQDFEILAFPSNDFGGQEPLEEEGLGEFCESYGANFPTFDKIRVRGPYADDLYKFLADKKANGKVSSVPRWNFHKYLIDREGAVVDFYYPFTKPTSSKIKKKVAKLLAAGK